MYRYSSVGKTILILDVDVRDNEMHLIYSLYGYTDVDVCWKEYMSCVWVRITPDVVIKTYVSALVNKHV